jgi:hypothetical protein
MKPAGTRKIRCAASFVHSNVEINGFFRSSRAMSLASPACCCRHSGQPRARSPRWRTGHDIDGAPSSLDHLPRKVERKSRQLHHARAFDARLTRRADKRSS